MFSLQPVPSSAVDVHSYYNKFLSFLLFDKFIQNHQYLKCHYLQEKRTKMFFWKTFITAAALE